MIDKQYEDLLFKVLSEGEEKPDRTGTGTYSLFGAQLRYDLQRGFPLITTKKVHFKSVVGELLFFLSGETNQKDLLDSGVGIWREWGDANGNLGPIYSHQWRHWGGEHTRRIQPARPSASTLGGYVFGKDKNLDALHSTWKGMIQRCYDPAKSTYAYYGGRGVHVVGRWMNFTNFVEDAVNLAGWDSKLLDWSGVQLDKDIHGDGFSYSPDTCAWVSRSENSGAKNRKVYTLENGEGVQESTSQPSVFRMKHGISQGNFDSMLRGSRASAGGWELVDVYDPAQGTDQIANVIESIKADPHSRRHIVSAWNVGDLEHMALAPCHVLFQFYVSADGKRLSCHLFQRSADVFLGLPFNIASYALLTHIIAAQTGLEVGELLWSGTDVHLYKNHEHQAEEQLSREVRQFPSLKYKPYESLENYVPSDFELEGYNPHPAIKAPVAV